MKKIFVPVLFLIVTACKNGSDVRPSDVSTVKTPVDINQIIRNGIEITSNGGVNVKQAFMLRSNGSLLTDDNKINVGEIVELRVLAEGWKGDAQKNLSLGASEKITTNDGAVAIDEQDVFKNQPAIPVQKAELIRLQATVTKQEKRYDFYKVDFKVWNKNTDQSITGTYKLYVK